MRYACGITRGRDIAMKAAADAKPNKAPSTTDQEVALVSETHYQQWGNARRLGARAVQSVNRPRQAQRSNAVRASHSEDASSDRRETGG